MPKSTEKEIFQAQHSTPDAYPTFAPILRVPQDILSLVFEICTTYDSTEGNVMTMRSAPWTLSHICRRWRDTALDTPSLWKVIRIDREQYRSVMDPLSMLRAWLQRSRSTPISCSIDFPWTQAAHDRDLEDGIVDLVIGEAHRWRDVLMELGCRPDCYYRVGSIRKPLLLLRFFQISANLWRENTETSDVFKNSAFATAPNLAVVNFDVLSLVLPIPIPWHQIQRCRVFDWELFFKQSTSMGNLCHLSLVGDFAPSSDPLASPSKLSLARLRRLETNFLSLQLTAQLLDISFLPSLQDLKVEAQHSVSGTSTQLLLRSIGNLQQRSSCELKRLNIAVFPSDMFSSPSSLELIRSLDTVEELHFSLRYQSFGSPDTPGKLMAHLHDMSVLPRLKALYLNIHQLSDGPYYDGDSFFDEIADVVAARRKPNPLGVQLERFSIDAQPSFHTNDISKPSLPACLRGIRRILKVQSEQGLELVEPVVEGWLCPVHKRASHWDAERLDEDAARFNLFGSWSILIF